MPSNEDMRWFREEQVRELQEADARHKATHCTCCNALFTEERSCSLCKDKKELADTDFDETLWTHFAEVPKLTHEEAAKLRAAFPEVQG